MMRVVTQVAWPIWADRKEIAVEFKKAKQATEEQIREMEVALGHTFPEDYRLHLLQHDGGYPEFDYFEYEREGEMWEPGIGRFYCVSPDKHYNILQKSLVYAERIPKEFFPFAGDGFGNNYIMGKPGTEFEGKVYFWDHEMEAEEGEPPRWDNIHFIANSFTEFLGMLGPDPEDDE